MRPWIASLALVALSFPALSLATAQVPAAKNAARQERVEIRRLIEGLASPDFEVRKRSAKKLEAYGKKARALLLEVVEESDDAEQVWQARRLLRRSEKGRPGLKARPKGTSPSGSGRAQGKSESRKSGGRSQRLQGFGMRDFPGFKQGESPEQFARRIQEFMKRHAVDLSRGMKDGRSQAQSQSEGTKIMVGPGGVEVDISITQDGKSQRKNYKAKSMEELLAKYPELKGRVSGGASFGGREIEDMERQVERMERRLRDLLENSHPGISLPPRPAKLQDLPPSDGPKLGIYVGSAETESVGKFLGLPDGVGLWVEGHTKGSLAEKLGLQKGDLLVRLGGKWIRNPGDVAKVLTRKANGKKLEAQWYRKGKKMKNSVGD